MAERPLIGLTTGTTAVPIPEGSLDSYYTGRAYVDMLHRVGADVVLLAAVGGDEEPGAERMLGRLDGLMVSGGIDIEPSFYGGDWEPVQEPDPPRDAFEAALIRGALERGMPVLGVCRGMQMINVALGGTLHREAQHTDVPATDEGSFRGVRRHELELAERSRVRAALGRGRVEVLCLHHQAPDRIGAGLEVTARAADGIVEAVELAEESPFCLGVLWHPEQMVGEEDMQGRLYGSLVEAAREYAGVGVAR